MVSIDPVMSGIISAAATVTGLLVACSSRKSSTHLTGSSVIRASADPGSAIPPGTSARPSRQLPVVVPVRLQGVQAVEPGDGDADGGACGGGEPEVHAAQ